MSLLPGVNMKKLAAVIAFFYRQSIFNKKKQDRRPPEKTGICPAADGLAASPDTGI